ncbi:UDP-N-acetylglucosamine 2-epimerase (non-hydrolyzing) [Candidatus Pacearchaeota archaeon]|nr:UDP-N-acetylglucosamine 2-epimerase (non-hydrolyzing) [Candidatus Pacearchaeota archaeon]
MIHIILGTRAQLIKMAPIMKEMQNQNIDYNFIFLAQHKETMNSMIEMFGIKKPDVIIGNIDQDITNSRTMALWSMKVITYALLNKNKVFRNDKNGIVLVHGDAPPAFLGALIAKCSGLKVAHIESGLRSFNLFSPFPEEIIRILTFSLTNYYFSPGDWAINNLKKYRGKKINTKENTLLDALHIALKNLDKIEVDIPTQKYCMATIHRFENISEKNKFKEILDIIENISKKIKVLFILHPPTRKKLEEYRLLEKLKENKNIELRPRYDYFEFIKLVINSEFLITDGGSNQEECYYLGKPCLLFRNETERKEGLGKNVLLSKFDKSVIDNFVDNYLKYKFDTLDNNLSVSKMIVNEIR